MAAKNKVPAPIILTAVFSIACTVGLSVFAAVALAADTQLVGAASWAFVGVVLLAIGTHQLLAKRNRLILLIPLCAVLAIGCVGETIDIIGTATLQSNAIGAGILLLFAIPVTLLLLPASREWSSAKV